LFLFVEALRVVEEKKQYITAVCCSKHTVLFCKLSRLKNFRLPPQNLL
jgi:hypothetical protein